MGSTHAQMRLITINIIHIFELIILQQQQQEQQQQWQQLNDNQHGERKNKKTDRTEQKKFRPGLGGRLNLLAIFTSQRQQKQ